MFFSAVGDSHMRHSFYQIVRKTGGPQLYKKIGEDVDVKRWHFKWANYCHVLKERLAEYIMERGQESSAAEGSEPSRHLLLFEGGHWDIRVNSIQVCFSQDRGKDGGKLRREGRREGRKKGRREEEQGKKRREKEEGREGGRERRKKMGRRGRRKKEERKKVEAKRR